MKEKESISALSLYAAYREIPEDIDEKQKAKLSDDINSAVLIGLKKEPERIKAIINNKFAFAWIGFLSEDTLARIRKKQ